MKNKTKTIEAFKAIGDASRFKILQLLSKYETLCVSSLATRLKIAQPTVSQHLKILKNADLVRANRIGNHIHYYIKPNTLTQLSEWLDDLATLKHLNCADQKCKMNCKDIKSISTLS